MVSSTTPMLALVDYGCGNLHSAEKALQRAAHMADRPDLSICITDDPDLIVTAERIVLPGVGSFGGCAQGLRARTGVIEAMDVRVRGQSAPFLGICVGAQLLFERGHERSAEAGAHGGLGWMEGEVVALTPADARLKVPHMGWNQLHIARAHPVLSGVTHDTFEGAGARSAGGGAAQPYGYFVHSFHVKHTRPEDLIATANYGGPVTAVVGRDTMVGTQFHPEKSQAFGLQLLANFIAWRP